MISVKVLLNITDDTQVYGNNTNHVMHLYEAVERTRQAGHKLNYDKYVTKTKSCTFFGNIYSPKGVIPDPKKLKLSKRCKPHKLNKNCNLLGMINYLGQFIKDMSQLTHNMRLLPKKNALFQWAESHEANFQKLKESISSDTCLMDFDTSKPINLQVDASQVGLGAVHLQEDSQGRTRPVAYASKALTPCETRYANIEREMLAIAWGCIKCHHYLYVRKFFCHTDHKLLEDIHLKHLSDAPPRLQRLLLKLQPDVIVSMFQIKKFQLLMH